MDKAKPESFLSLLALPHSWSPSHADWLNDLSSTPPVSVTIAALTLESADDPPRPPRAHAEDQVLLQQQGQDR